MYVYIYIYIYIYENPEFRSLPVVLYSHMKTSWIEQDKAASDGYGRNLYVDGDMSQYKHAPLWYSKHGFREIESTAYDWEWLWSFAPTY